MRSRCFFSLFLIACTAFAQAGKQTQAPAAPPSGGPQTAAPAAGPTPAAQKPAPSSSLPDSSIVLTLDGVCDPTNPIAAPPCKTEITKGEFDRLMNLITPPGTPPLPPVLRRERANQLAQLLTLAAVARKSGALDTPDGQESLKLATLQALTNAYIRQLQNSTKPTPVEVETYYKNNQDKFQQAVLKQLFVPPLQPVAGKTPDAAAQPARAEKFRERAFAGEPFDKLQKEAIEGTQYPTAPPVDVTFRKESLPPARQSVFELKNGEISKVITEPAGSVIYKMVSKGPVPFAQIKDTLAQQMQQEKFQAALESASKGPAPVLNDAYFGSAAPVATPGAPAPPQPGPVTNPDAKLPK